MTVAVFARRPAAPPLAAHTPHVPELQSIRGIAALVVVVGHCISYYATPEWWVFVKHLVNTQSAVELFFILSGFVLSLSLVRRPIDGSAVLAYYVKRLFRIYPALIVASAFACVYVFAVHRQVAVPGMSRWISERFRADRFSTLYVAASFAGMLAFLIPPVWTIFVEIVASVAMPGIAWLLARRRRWFWLALAAFVAISLGLGGRLYYRADMYLMDFALGASLLAIDPAPLHRGLARINVPLGFATIVAALLFVCTRAFLWVDVWDPATQLYEAILGAFVVFAFGRAGLVSATLRGRVMVWLGDISYSVYLLHFTVMCLFAKALALAAPGLVPGVGGIVAGLLLCVPTALVSLPLASLSFRWIERPGIAVGTRIVRGSVGGPPATPGKSGTSG